MKTKEEKRAKKARKKLYKKAIRPWKGLSIFSGVMAFIMILACFICTAFDNPIAIVSGDKFWRVENLDLANYTYFPNKELQFKTQGATSQKDIAKLVEAGGATLLKNENEALPLDVENQSDKKVSIFSTSSVNPVYGGTGSGNVDASKAKSFKEAFEDVGLDVNDTLWNFYESGAGKKYVRKNGGIMPVSAEVSEAPWGAYTQEVIDSVSGTAVVVLSRIGGEGYDASYTLDGQVNYLALDENEKKMLSEIQKMKQSGKINKIVLLLNYSNSVQLDFIDSYSIDACLWIGGVGINGIEAVADILVGKTNPSGSLPDTHLKNNFSSPAMVNSVALEYEGAQERVESNNARHYMVYQEGIYVGYRYFETRYFDTVMGRGNTDGYNYDQDVAYPFGYGLSYTSFEYSNFDMSYDAQSDTFNVSVTVTNTGDRAGRETVQVYASAPYTHGISTVEKSAVVLVGYDKTDLLAPSGEQGSSQTLNIKVDKKSLASYDCTANDGKGGYILDSGNYYLTVASSAHEATNNVLAVHGKNTTNSSIDKDGDLTMVGVHYQENYDSTTYNNILVNGKEVTIQNQLDMADLNRYEGADNGPIDNGVVYLSRADWANTYPKSATKVKLTAKIISDLKDIQYLEDAKDYVGEGLTIPEVKDLGLKLYDFIGVGLDEKIVKDGVEYSWDDLIGQMSFAEMRKLIGDSFHWTHPVESIDAPGTRDENGPQGLNTSIFLGASSGVETIAFCSEDVMSATFDDDLMYDVGQVFGKNCIDSGITFLYGPGNNIHRTPYGGRNFEYYSEDGFLSGKISAQEVRGMKVYGVEVLMKHFALNESEQQRLGLGVWLNEQSAREIYLKAFQIPIEEANANGVMTAYARWGCIWSGGNPNLMTKILREEWGCKGMQITDNCLVNYVNSVDGVIAGVTTFDNMLPYIYDDFGKYENDSVIYYAMQRASKYNLYAIANSNAMNGFGPNTEVHNYTPSFTTWSTVLAIVMPVCFVGCLTTYIVKRVKFKKKQRENDLQTKSMDN